MTLDQIAAAVRIAPTTATRRCASAAAAARISTAACWRRRARRGGLCGIVAYEPTELYLTAKCGTPLAEIEAALAEKGQMLACEPPHFPVRRSAAASPPGFPDRAGSRRVPCATLCSGVKLVDGSGQILDFGGRVMKNVAGYDVSRLLVGSLARLAWLAEVTLKVLPRPVAEKRWFRREGGRGHRPAQPLGGPAAPVSALVLARWRLWLRSRGRGQVAAARGKLGGTLAVDAEKHWISVREQTHPAFSAPVLWRLALPSTVPPPAVDKLRAIEWAAPATVCRRNRRERHDAVRGAAARLGMPCSITHPSRCAAWRALSRRWRRPCSPCIAA